MSVPYALYAEKAASVDAAQLAQTLNSADVQAILNFVNKTEINSTLSNYALKTDIPAESNLSGYVTTEYLNDTLSYYLTSIASGEALLRYYYPQSTIDAMLSYKANISDLADVATSGSYNDLTDKPVNVSTFNNDANYLVASDIAGKADKSEMSITNGSGTATIQLKSGTSATVLTQHQSIANNSTIQELQQQIAALQTALNSCVKNTKVTVTVNYKNVSWSGTNDAANPEYIWFMFNGEKIVNGSSKTITKDFYFSNNQKSGEIDWAIQKKANSSNYITGGFVVIKVNGAMLTQTDCPYTLVRVSTGSSDTKKYTVKGGNSTGSEYVEVSEKSYALTIATEQKKASKKPTSGTFTDGNYFPWTFTDDFNNYKPIPLEKILQSENNTITVDLYGYRDNSN